MNFLQNFSEPSQLFFLGSIFILAGAGLRKLHSTIVRYRASFTPKEAQPEQS